MAKLPWYVKSNGVENIGGNLFVNIKIRRIYIIWVKIRVFFEMAKDKLNPETLMVLMMFVFAAIIGLICGLCSLIELAFSNL